MSFIIPEVFVNLILDTLIAIFMTIGAFNSFKIARGWRSGSGSQQQYKLEKRAYLVSTITKYVILLKLPLLIFFIYTNDKMATVLTGAMCAAGSINSTVYGSYLLYAKVFNIFLFSLWVIANHYDSKQKELPFMVWKFRLIIFISIAIIFELALAYTHFMSIDPTAVVSCCSAIYSSTGESIIAKIDGAYWFFLFITAYLFLLIAHLKKSANAISALNIAYFLSAIASLTNFVSTYVYELPTHKCPFCILQADYYYVGYLFYITLFTGVSVGGTLWLIKKIKGDFPTSLSKISFIANTLYLMLSVNYPLSFYLKNGVWL